MDAVDLEVCRAAYRRFVELGRGPTVVEIADEVGRSADGVATSLARLHEAHALVLDLVSGEILMANPFSAVETPHRVSAAGRDWYANCAWDAFGITAALHVDGHVSSRCPCCGGEIEIEVRDRSPVIEAAVCHVLVPAARWWDDIAFT